MRGRGCCSHLLKALEAYLSRMYCFSCGRLSLVGAQGRVGGSDGGGCLGGHEHGSSSGLETPELVQGWLGPAVAAAVMAGVSQLPMVGKEAGMVPRSAQASLERKGYGTERDT